MSNSNNPPYKFAKGAAFFSSLASLILLSSIFTFKNLSFSSHLFNSTNFWFFISNALIILIIAADYNRIFSPTQNKRLDFYEDYISSNQNQTQILQSSSLPVIVDEERETPEEKLQIVVGRRDFGSCRRSKSEKPKRKTMGRRSESVKYEAKGEGNEFSNMTDEELKRRVEEFIQRINRQMRLQSSN